MVYVDSSLPSVDVAQWRSEHWDVRVHPPYQYAVWEQFWLPRWAASDRVDLLHCPANTGPLVLPRRVKIILTLHDVIFLLPPAVTPLSPSPYQRLGRAYRRVVATRIVNRAAAIIAPSNRTRDDVVRWLGVPPDQIQVIHNAPDAVFRRLPRSAALDDVKRRYGLREQFILAMGGVDPRKNTSNIIQAFARAKREHRLPHQLVIVGLPPRASGRFADAADALCVGGDVVLLDFVPEEALVSLYNAATVFLYPSLYEGFGFPVLEAMACGTLVVASAAGSIPEIAGDAALLVNPIDTAELADAIARLMFDESLRQILARKGIARAAEFSWTRTATATMRVYEETSPPD